VNTYSTATIDPVETTTRNTTRLISGSLPFLLQFSIASLLILSSTYFLMEAIHHGWYIGYALCFATTVLSGPFIIQSVRYLRGECHVELISPNHLCFQMAPGHEFCVFSWQIQDIRCGWGAYVIKLHNGITFRLRLKDAKPEILPALELRRMGSRRMGSRRMESLRLELEAAKKAKAMAKA
jgi:hypothetical protein